MAADKRMLLNALISICIPTYKRPDLLIEALDTCFAQTYTDFEIVIGDDSPDDLTQTVVDKYLDAHKQPIRYAHHRPSLGQNLNVNDLFIRARGARLLLLHDDDLLLPTALEHLASCWESVPDLDGVFGKQYLVENDGTPLSQQKSDQLNADYYRVAANAGLQSMPIATGILRMFPNDGYMVDSILAREIGYRSRQEVGDACDTDFGIRFCAAARKIWFVDEFTSKYRITAVSVGNSALLTHSTYQMLLDLKVPREAESTLVTARRTAAPGALSAFARLGYTGKALQIFLSHDYPLKKMLSARGVYHLLLIMRSLFVSPKRD